MKVIFTGAQGTGKTSVMDALPDSLYKIKGVTRKVITEKNLTINEYSDNCSQKHIFDAYEHELTVNDNYIAERGLIDVLAYSLSRLKANRCTPTLIETQYEHLIKFSENNKDVVYVYFPIEFEIVSDGTRSIDKEFQKEIDDIIYEILEAMKTRYGTKFITVSGSVEERAKQIENLFN
jgi:predicted ATPase